MVAARENARGVQKMHANQEATDDSRNERS
jgi:hypothetical protein